MLKLFLAFMVVDNKITYEKAQIILDKIGKEPIPKTLEETIKELKKYL